MDATITAIKQNKRNPQRVSIFLDNEFAFPLAKIVAAWLKVGQRLSPEKIQELQQKDEEEKAFQRAVKFINYRPRSGAEVEKNLRKHEVPEIAIQGVLERLNRGNLLNDTEFAHRWIEDRAAFRPRGAYALRAELRQKGIPEQTIEEAMIKVDEIDLARRAAQKKIRQWANLEWPDYSKKISGFLSRRGFGYEIVNEITKELWQETHESLANTNN